MAGRSAGYFFLAGLMHSTLIETPPCGDWPLCERGSAGVCVICAECALAARYLPLCGLCRVRLVWGGGLVLSAAKLLWDFHFTPTTRRSPMAGNEGAKLAFKTTVDDRTYEGDLNDRDAIYQWMLDECT